MNTELITKELEYLYFEIACLAEMKDEIICYLMVESLPYGHPKAINDRAFIERIDSEIELLRNRKKRLINDFN